MDSRGASVVVRGHTSVRVVLSFVLRLGTGTPRQNLAARKRKEGWGREKRGEKDAAEKRSEDQLVARIGFRTVSNDTGQDTTATMVPGYPPTITSTPAFFFLWGLFGAVLGLVEVVGRVGMKSAP